MKSRFNIISFIIATVLLVSSFAVNINTLAAGEFKKDAKLCNQPDTSYTQNLEVNPGSCVTFRVKYPSNAATIQGVTDYFENTYLEDVLPSQLTYTPNSIVDHLSSPNLAGTNIGYISGASNPTPVVAQLTTPISDTKQNTVAYPNTLKNTFSNNTITYAPGSGNSLYDKAKTIDKVLLEQDNFDGNLLTGDPKLATSSMGYNPATQTPNKYESIQNATAGVDVYIGSTFAIFRKNEFKNLGTKSDIQNPSIALPPITLKPNSSYYVLHTTSLNQTCQYSFNGGGLITTQPSSTITYADGSTANNIFINTTSNQGQTLQLSNSCKSIVYFSPSNTYTSYEVFNTPTIDTSTQPKPVLTSPTFTAISGKYIDSISIFRYVSPGAGFLFEYSLDGGTTYTPVSLAQSSQPIKINQTVGPNGFKYRVTIEALQGVNYPVDSSFSGIRVFQKQDNYGYVTFNTQVSPTAKTGDPNIVNTATQKRVDNQAVLNTSDVTLTIASLPATNTGGSTTIILNQDKPSQTATTTTTTSPSTTPTNTTTEATTTSSKTENTNTVCQSTGSEVDGQKIKINLKNVKKGEQVEITPANSLNINNFKFTTTSDIDCASFAIQNQNNDATLYPNLNGELIKAFSLSDFNNINKDQIENIVLTVGIDKNTLKQYDTTSLNAYISNSPWVKTEMKFDAQTIGADSYSIASKVSFKQLAISGTKIQANSDVPELIRTGSIQNEKLFLVLPIVLISILSISVYSSNRKS
jgi:hypothetical protein